jgi:antirestriction protein ArdC
LKPAQNPGSALWRGNARRSAIIPRRTTGKAYRGINVIMLLVAGQTFGYEENIWVTYRQAQTSELHLGWRPDRAATFWRAGGQAALEDVHTWPAGRSCA